MPAIHDLSALEQAAAIRDGELSPVEIAEHYLSRIDKHNAATGAFITVTEEAALHRAREAHRAVVEGLPLQSLHGVPIGIKDLHHTAGVRTTMGSALHADFVPDFDDHAVALLTRAGVNSLGKTNVPEFGYPFYTENLIAPPARTPWDLSRSAGGSSGGAAAAVAAGLLPFAHASDGGGSLRVPASVCGLYGFKPSRGRISNGPASADVTAFSCNGAIARTVADAAALVDAMAEPIPTEPFHAPSLPAGVSFLSYTRRDPPRLRIGRYRVPCVPGASVARDCVDAWAHASVLLTGLGHDVVDVPPPFSEEFWRHMRTVHRAGQAPNRTGTGQRHLLTPLTEWLRESAAELSAAEFLAAMKGLRMAARRAIDETSACDVLLTPTLAAPPRPVGWFTQDVPPAATFRRIGEFSPFTAPYNVTGQPAASLPLWWNDERLPIGIMLAGKPFADGTVLSLSAQLERAVPWHANRPDIW